MALEQLHHRPGTQIAAADADDHQHLGILLNPFRRLLDAGKFRPVIGHRQPDPAQKVLSRAGALLQGLPGHLQTGYHRGHLFPGYGVVNGCVIDSDHAAFLLFRRI